MIAVIHAARNGDISALEMLLDDLRPVMRGVCSEFFAPGLDDQDIAQEALIGAWAAIRDFDPAVGTSLRTFADLCVRRQVITAVKTAQRMKHRPLNESERDGRAEGGEVLSIVDLIEARNADPCEIIALRADLRELAAGLADLTAVERDVFTRHMNGEPQLFSKLNPERKRNDNAMQRARVKLHGRLAA